MHATIGIGVYQFRYNKIISPRVWTYNASIWPWCPH